MASRDSIKNRVNRTASDPFNCIVGRGPETYRIPEVGDALIEAVDYALFERKLENALIAGILMERWAGADEGDKCKAQAVLGGIYSACGMQPLAEEKFLSAKTLLEDECDRQAEYYRRLGTFLWYDNNTQDAQKSYHRSFVLSKRLGDVLGAAKSIIARGSMKWIQRDWESALDDQEAGLDLIKGYAPTYYIVIGASVNIATILTSTGRTAEARAKIEEIQGQIVGLDGMEKMRVLLRWIRALLLELDGETKNAGQMLDRVEARLRKLDMRLELRTVLADRARIARGTASRKKIARKALEIERFPLVRTKIERVIEEPNIEHIQEWRDALDSYVPSLNTLAA